MMCGYCSRQTTPGHASSEMSLFCGFQNIVKQIREKLCSGGRKGGRVRDRKRVSLEMGRGISRDAV